MAFSKSLGELKALLASLVAENDSALDLAEQAGLPRERIDADGPAFDTWHSILTEADKRGLVPAIVDVAASWFAERAGELEALKQAYLAEPSRPPWLLLLDAPDHRRWLPVAVIAAAAGLLLVGLVLVSPWVPGPEDPTLAHTVATPMPGAATPDPAYEILVADRERHAVLRFSAETGKFLGDFLGEGAEGYDKPGAMALYGGDLADCQDPVLLAGFESGKVRVYDSNGEYCTRVDVTNKDLEEPADMLIVGTRLFVLYNDSFELYTVDLISGDQGEVGEGFRYGHALAQKSDHQLAIAHEGHEGKVSILNLDTDNVREFGEELTLATGVAYERHDNLLVSDFRGGTVFRYDGQHYDDPAPLIRDLKGPSELEIGPDGLGYVLTEKGIHRFELNGEDLGLFIEVDGELLKRPAGFLFRETPK